MVSAIIADIKTQNTPGGGFDSGAWRTRTLNSILVDLSGLVVSLSSNQIRLQAGKYYVYGIAPAFSVKNHQLRIQNITSNTTILEGCSSYSEALPSMDKAEILGSITVNGTDLIELQHRCAQTRATDGFGVPANFSSEIYATIRFDVAGA